MDSLHTNRAASHAIEPAQPDGAAAAVQRERPQRGLLDQVADAAAGGLDARMLMRMLDEIDYGLMLVGDGGMVLHANQAALRACAASAGLRLDAGRVRPSDDRLRTAFLNALESSRQGRRCLLALDADGRRAVVAVVPVSGLRGGDTATLVVLGRSRVCEPLSLDFFARAHRLTHAEGAVLESLCDGLRPAQIAHRSGVAISTVRTQLSSIRGKTNTSSVSELVDRLATLPPVRQVVQRTA